MAVGARGILRPEREAAAPVALIARIVAIERSGWEHESREGELGGLIPVGRDFELVIFDAGKLMERALKRECGAREGEPDCTSTKKLARAHLAILTRG